MAYANTALSELETDGCRLLKAYPEIKNNGRNLLLLYIALLHDVCKVGFYKVEYR